VSLWMLIVTPTQRGYMPSPRSGRPELPPVVHRVCGTLDFEVVWGYACRLGDVSGDGRRIRSDLSGGRFDFAENPAVGESR
jgi:hypothetical protein